MITLTKELEKVVPSKNPTLIEGSTDNYVNNSDVPQVLVLSAPIPSALEPDETYTWKVGEYEFQWVFKASPDNSGFQVQEDFASQAALEFTIRNHMNQCPAFTQNVIQVLGGFYNFPSPGYYTISIAKTASDTDLEFVGTSNVSNAPFVVVTNYPSEKFSAKDDFRIIAAMYEQGDILQLPQIVGFGELDSSPDNAGDFYLNMQSALRSAVKWYLPNFDNLNFQACPGMAKAFWIKLIEQYYDGTQTIMDGYKNLFPAGVLNGLDGQLNGFDGTYYTVIHGKMPLLDYSPADYLAEYCLYGATKKFLTHRPRKSSTHLSEPIWLYYTSIGELAKHKLWCKLYLANGSSDTAEIQDFIPAYGTADSFVHAVPVGFANNPAMDAFLAARDVLKYEVWLTDELDAVISETLTFEIDDRDFVEINYLLFESPLGGLDTFRITGDIVATDSTSGEVVHLAAKEYQSEPFYQMVNNISQGGFVIHSGNRKSQEEIKWAAQVYNSENVYLLRKGEMHKITVEKTEDVPVWSNRSSLYNLTLNCKLAHHD